MSAALSVCPHCSADIKSIGTPGVCWQCKEKLTPDGPSAGESDLPSSPFPGWAAPSSWGLLTAFTVAALVISAIKFFMVFIAIPILILMLPTLILTRWIVRALMARGQAQPRLALFARLQLVGAAAGIIAIPSDEGAGQVRAFGLFVATQSNYLSKLGDWLLFLGLFAWLASTVAIIGAYARVRLMKPRLV